jgi:glycosyltransferase involved in cell wall biosynthesis
MFVMGGLDGEASGPDIVVSAVANALARRGHPVTVYAGGCKEARIPPQILHPPNRCITAPGWWLGGLSYSPALRCLLEEAIAENDIVHHHSIWMLPNHYASAAAFRYGKPCLYQLHGTLEPGAVKRSSWRKRIVAAWFQDRDFRRAACMYVSSRRELEGIRQYGLKHPTAIIPHGVDIEPFLHPPPRSNFDARFPSVAGKRICLFLSRLHEKKGLTHLVDAWHRVVADYPQWHLVLTGPDCGMETTCRAMVHEHGLNSAVTFTGALCGDAKAAAYAAASLFVLPSFSEGFSMAVLEAMAAGCPVLITPECNFPEVQTVGAGLLVSPNAESVEQGFRQLLSATDAELADMGSRGRAMVRSHYTWDGVASRLLELYAWMLGGGPPPPFVEMA